MEKLKTVVIKNANDVKALKALAAERNIEFVSSGCQLAVGPYTATIGDHCKSIPFNKDTQMLLLQVATANGKDCSFVISENQLPGETNAFIPGKTLQIEVFVHETSGQKRVRIVKDTDTPAENIAAREVDVIKAEMETALDAGDADKYKLLKAELQKALVNA